MIRIALAAALLALTGTGPALAAAVAAAPPKPAGAIERPFEYTLTIDGRQDWVNGPQNTAATTHQEYRVRTRLRSDGVLYSDNLLDPDQTARLDIKEQYYARMGLNALKRANGGRLPDSADDAQAVIDRRQAAGVTCFGSFECNQRAIEQLAAINALKANSREDLEGFLEAPGIGDVPRYQFYFGYGGCPVNIRVTYDVTVTGTRAFDRKREKLEPYALKRVADSTGSDEDRSTLCEKYVVVVDTIKGGVFVENLFIPSPIGSSTLDRSGLATTERDIPLPPPFEVLNWTSEVLRQAPADRLDQTVTLPMDFPLDGDHTIQGRFNGEAKVRFQWSFAAAPGTAAAASKAAPAANPAPPARKAR